VGRTDDEADSLIDSIRRRATLPTETFAAMQTREFQAAMAMRGPPGLPPSDPNGSKP
jgi:hypothetical protein